MSLETAIEHFFVLGADAVGDAAAMTAFLELRTALETGTLRSAEPDAASPTGWRVNAWVKRGILLGFRLGQMVEMDARTALGSSIRRPTRRDGSRWPMASGWCRAVRASGPARMWQRA